MLVRIPGQEEQADAIRRTILRVAPVPLTVPDVTVG
jgi:hypothetical protein